MSPRPCRKDGIHVLVYCPFCGRSLNATGDRFFLQVCQGEQQAVLFLSAILDDFWRECEGLVIVDGEACDLRCPHPDCDRSFLAAPACPTCGAPRAALLARYPSRDGHIAICSRAGCHWHSIDRYELQYPAAQSEPQQELQDGRG